jgi:hypothetical protein
MLKPRRLRCRSRNLFHLTVCRLALQTPLQHTGYYRSILPFLTLKDSAFCLHDLFFGGFVWVVWTRTVSVNSRPLKRLFCIIVVYCVFFEPGFYFLLLYNWISGFRGLIFGVKIEDMVQRRAAFSNLPYLIFSSPFHWKMYWSTESPSEIS